MSQAINQAREMALEQMEALAAIASTRALTPGEQIRFDKLEVEINDLDKRAQAQRNQYANERSADTNTANVRIKAVAKQPSKHVEINERDHGHYANRAHGGGGQSWFRDIARTTIMSDPDAQRRLHETDESRASQTLGTDSAGGYLSPPTTLLNLYRDALSANAPMLEHVTRMELPTSTMQVSVPKATSSTSPVYHTELSPISSTPMAFDVVAADVSMVAGLANLSVQALEQAPAPGLDNIIIRDLAKQVALKINASILKGTTPFHGLYDDAHTNVTYTDSSPTFAEFLPKLAAAAKAVATSYYSPATAVVMHPRTIWALASAVDKQDRPIVDTGLTMSTNSGLRLKSDANGTDGVVGTILGISLIADASIPTTLGSGTNEAFALVLDPAAFYLYTRPPVFEVDRSSGFTNASVNVRARQYVAGSLIHPEAVAKITGTGLAWDIS